MACLAADAQELGVYRCYCSQRKYGGRQTGSANNEQPSGAAKQVPRNGVQARHSGSPRASTSRRGQTSGSGDSHEDDDDPMWHPSGSDNGETPPKKKEPRGRKRKAGDELAQKAAKKPKRDSAETAITLQ